VQCRGRARDLWGDAVERVPVRGKHERVDRCTANVGREDDERVPRWKRGHGTYGSGSFTGGRQLEGQHDTDLIVVRSLERANAKVRDEPRLPACTR
jgi:hypothetical protein